MTDDFAIRNASYDVRREVPAGSLATVRTPAPWAVRKPGTNGLTADSYDRGVLKPGSRVKIMHYVNAGFRGIECTVQLPDGRFAHGISAGHFSPVQVPSRVV